MTIPLWVIGSGGHAKVVIDAARATGRFTIAGVLDDDGRRHGATILGVRVMGDTANDTVVALGVEHAVIAIGANHVRERVAARLGGTVTWTSVTHPAATIAPDTTIGIGSVIMAGAVVQPGCMVGDHVIVNTQASADHDCRIGDYCHLGPGTHLAADVEVGDGAFLGVGVSVIPGRRIGRWSTVGAGAVVVRDLPPLVTASGVPARPHA